MSLLGVEEVIRCHIDTNDRVNLAEDSANCTVSVAPIQGANWIRVASVSIPISSGTFQLPRDPTGKLFMDRQLENGTQSSAIWYILGEAIWSKGDPKIYTESALATLMTDNFASVGWQLVVSVAPGFSGTSLWTNNGTDKFTFTESNPVFGVFKGDVIPSGGVYTGRATMQVDGKNDFQYLSLPSILTNNRVSRSAGRNSTQNIACRVPNNTGVLSGAYATWANQLSDDWSRLTGSAIEEIEIVVFNRNRDIQSLNGFPVYATIEFK